MSFHHNTIRKYTAALISFFNNIEIQYSTSSQVLKTKKIPLQYKSKEKANILEHITEEELQHGMHNVLPKASSSINGLAKNQEHQTNQSNKIGRYVTNDEMEYMYNSVNYVFDYSYIVKCRGMNEATQIIEQILPMFNPIVYLDIWDADNLNEPTRVPLILQSTDIETEEYDDLSSNIVTIIFNLELFGNVYQPLKTMPKIKQFQLYVNNIINEDTAINDKMIEWNTDGIDIANNTLSDEIFNLDNPQNMSNVKSMISNVYKSKLVRLDEYIRSLQISNVQYADGINKYYELDTYIDDIPSENSKVVIEYGSNSNDPMEVLHYINGKLSRIDFYKDKSNYSKTIDNTDAYILYVYTNDILTSTSYFEKGNDFNFYNYINTEEINQIIYADGASEYFPIIGDDTDIPSANSIVQINFKGSYDYPMDIVRYKNGKIVRIDKYEKASYYNETGTGRSSYIDLIYTNDDLTSTIVHKIN